MDRTQKKELAGRLYKKGVKETEIAETIGCSVASVSIYLRELGLKQRKPLGLAMKCVDLHLKGYSHTQIAYELEVSKSYVYEKLREKGYINPYPKYYENLINEDTKYAVDPNTKPLEKLTIFEKWQIRKGVKFRKKIHYTDITPLFAPR